MNNKSITATGTLLGSLAAYYYAKQTGKDAVPYVMIGGFFGSLIGELISGNGSDNGNKGGGRKQLK
jgi:presenilin-like A22 family membrane protease